MNWWRGYDRRTLAADLLASAIVTIMLIPQSLAYALIAGMPPEAGLYASIAPAIVYACIGSSRVLAVGPVAVISLMTAAALGEVADRHGVSWTDAAAVLALLSGLLLGVLGLLRMGWIANLLSHSVVAGFVAGSALLIAFGQLPPLLGVDAGGRTLSALLPDVAASVSGVQAATAALGGGAVALLVLIRWGLPMLIGPGAAPWQRFGPIIVVALGIAVVSLAGPVVSEVAVVGTIPDGLPPLRWPIATLPLVVDLLVPAALLSLVGFVESISVGQSLAMRRRQRVLPDRELLGLGAANVAAGVTGGFPVTGGFSRSVVNFDAGAVTPLAGAFTGIGMALVALVLTPLFENLPRAVLAAVIIVAVLPLVDPRGVVRTLRHTPAEGGVLLATAVAVMFVGVETGVLTGVLVALALHLRRASRPHLAVIGRVPGTEHFRNVDRHSVEVADHLLSVRVDESLWFGNARHLEDRLLALVTEREDVTDVVLLCSAVNGIDGSGQHALESLSDRLAAGGVRLHLSEVKGPVMDGLERAGLPERLGGRIFFTQHEAMTALADRPPPGRAPITGAGDGI